jgi:hypothetical protein
VERRAGVAGKSATAITAHALAAAQTSALAARRREQDPASVRRLFLVATVLAVAVASLYAAVMVAEIDSVLVARLIGAAAVLDLLCVALQPVLAAARRATNAYRLRLVVEGGPEVEVTVEASRLAVAAARAIDRAERAGRRVVAIERVDRARS